MSYRMLEGVAFLDQLEKTAGGDALRRLRQVRHVPRGPSSVDCRHLSLLRLSSTKKQPSIGAVLRIGPCLAQVQQLLALALAQ